MEYKMLVILCCVIVTVVAEDRGRKGDERTSRFISLDTDNSDVTVNLDFTIPFLSIPMKKTVNSMVDGLPGLTLPTINLNPSALVFGGFIVMATTVILPLFSKGSTIYESNTYYRVLDNKSEESNILMDFTKQFVKASQGCPLRIACWMSQRSNNLTPTETVEQIIRNKLVSSIFNTSSIEEAIAQGRRGRDCSTYEPCPIREKHIPMIMKNFGLFTSRRFN